MLAAFISLLAYRHRVYRVLVLSSDMENGTDECSPQCYTLMFFSLVFHRTIERHPKHKTFAMAFTAVYCTLFCSKCGPAITVNVSIHVVRDGVKVLHLGQSTL